MDQPKKRYRVPAELWVDGKLKTPTIDATAYLIDKNQLRQEIEKDFRSKLEIIIQNKFNSEDAVYVTVSNSPKTSLAEENAHKRKLERWQIRQLIIVAASSIVTTIGSLIAPFKPTNPLPPIRIEIQTQDKQVPNRLYKNDRHAIASIEGPPDFYKLAKKTNEMFPELDKVWRKAYKAIDSGKDPIVVRASILRDLKAVQRKWTYNPSDSNNTKKEESIQKFQTVSAIYNEFQNITISNNGFRFAK